MDSSSGPASGRNAGAPAAAQCSSAPLSCLKAGTHRFGRDVRLLREAEFREAFDSGQGQAGRLMVLWVRRQPDAARRLGVVASKRTFHLATERNRAKRLMREAFRLQRHRLADGVDIVLLGRRSLLGVKRQDVEQDLLKLLKRSGVLTSETET